MRSIRHSPKTSHILEYITYVFRTTSTAVAERPRDALSFNVSLSHSRSLETAPFDRSHTLRVPTEWRDIGRKSLIFIPPLGRPRRNTAITFDIVVLPRGAKI